MAGILKRSFHQLTKRSPLWELFCPYHLIIQMGSLNWFTPKNKKKVGIQIPLKPSPDILEGLTPEERVNPNFAQTVFETTGRHLFRPCDIDQLDDTQLNPAETRPLRQAVQWLRDFIMRPHPKLGRPGAVCPFVKPAIEEELLYFTVARPTAPDQLSAIREELAVYEDIFKHMSPLKGPLMPLRAIIVIFPDCPEDVFGDPVFLKQIKTELMERGMSLGQFYPSQNTKMLLRSKFFPVQPPVSMYVLRTFVESDWEFIKGEPEWRQAYYHYFGYKPS